MWMVEIPEDKVEGLHAHIKKAYHHLGKVCECIEELKERGESNYREDDYEEDDYQMMGNRGRSGSRRGQRSGSRGMDGRYSTY